MTSVFAVESAVKIWQNRFEMADFPTAWLIKAPPAGSLGRQQLRYFELRESSIWCVLVFSRRGKSDIENDGRIQQFHIIIRSARLGRDRNRVLWARPAVKTPMPWMKVGAVSNVHSL